MLLAHCWRLFSFFPILCFILWNVASNPKCSVYNRALFLLATFWGEEGEKESAGNSAGNGEEGEKESTSNGEGEVERKKIKKN